MPKREVNWEPDIYDLAAERRAIAAENQRFGGISDLTRRASVASVEQEELDTEPEPVAVVPLTAQGQGKSDYRITVTYPQQPQSNDFFALAGMIAGAVAGAVLGLLLAPGRGEDTRRQLAQRARTEVEQRIEQVSGRDESLTDAPGPAVIGMDRGEEA